jgi:hypothetical protein
MSRNSLSQILITFLSVPFEFPNVAFDRFRDYLVLSYFAVGCLLNLPLDLENFQMRFGDYPDCGISAHGWKMSAIVNIHIYACRHVQLTNLPYISFLFVS